MPTVDIKCTCRFCQTVNFVTVRYDKLWAWNRGALIQDVWPDMPADQRELLISGTCSTCWGEMMFEEECSDFDPCDDCRKEDSDYGKGRQ